MFPCRFQYDIGLVVLAACHSRQQFLVLAFTEFLDGLVQSIHVPEMLLFGCILRSLTAPIGIGYTKNQKSAVNKALQLAIRQNRTNGEKTA